MFMYIHVYVSDHMYVVVRREEMSTLVVSALNKWARTLRIHTYIREQRGP